jgi:O-antigen/teichoic acid export membrane protein
MAIRLKPKIKIKYWGFCLSLTIPLIFHGLSQILLAQTGKITIQQFYGDSLAGVYSIAVVITGLLNAIYNALNNAFVPFMYDDLAGKTSESVKQNHFRNYFILFTVGTCAFALIAPEILKIMSTESYWSSTGVLPFLIIGQYCVFLYSFPVNYEFYKMKTSSIAVGTFLAALINIALSIALIPFLGMLGAALSTMISYLFLFVFHFLIARCKLGDKNYPARYYLYGLLLVSIVSFLYYPAENLLFLRWAVGLCLLAVLVLRVLKKRSIF